MTGLSQKAQDVAAFIGTYQAEHCRSPTFAEMAVAIGFQAKSKTSVYNILRQLERAGIVKLARDANGRAIKRGVELVSHPICPTCGQGISSVLKAGEAHGSVKPPSPLAAVGTPSEHREN